jgi:signal transduction histidine kinase
MPFRFTFWRLVCAAAILAAASIPVEAGGTRRHVLLLYSYDREFAHAAFSRVFQNSLSVASAEPVDFIEVSLHTRPSAQRDPDDSIVDDIRTTSDGMPIDLVVPIGGPAAVFAQQYRDALFPSTPILLASVDDRFLGDRTLPSNETAVMVRHDPPRMIETILRLLPETRTVVVVIGASAHDQFWLREVQRAVQPFENRLTFVFTNQWSYQELLDHCRSLPPHSVILYGLLMLDAKGVPRPEEQTLDALHATANAPLFGLHSPQLGHGIVGGPLISIEDLGRDTANVALRLLNGESAHAIGPRVMPAAAPMFDARELRRWGIAERLLQTGAIVRFREPAPLSPRTGPIVFGITIGALIGFAAIFALPRRTARASSGREIDGTNAEAALARLSQRLMQTQEVERAAIAKWIEDDVCQQLAAISMDLDARGERELCDQVSALARESLTVSDPTYAKLRLLGLPATARAFAEKACAVKGVALDFTVSDVPKDLPADAALVLFRVLEEAVQNALRHSNTASIVVSLRRAGDVIALDVADQGVGFDPDAAAREAALGLAGMRERLHPVGGECVVESRAGEGTRVRAFVPIRR